MKDDPPHFSGPLLALSVLTLEVILLVSSLTIAWVCSCFLNSPGFPDYSNIELVCHHHSVRLIFHWTPFLTSGSIWLLFFMLGVGSGTLSPEWVFNHFWPFGIMNNGLETEGTSWNDSILCHFRKHRVSDRFYWKKCFEPEANVRSCSTFFTPKFRPWGQSWGRVNIWSIT